MMDGSSGNPAFLNDLLTRWEAGLDLLRECGAHEAAATRETDLRELREWYRERMLEELTLEEAASWSGYAAESLRKQVSRGEIPNAGRKGRPRVRRCDLSMAAPGPPTSHSDTDAIAASILRARER